MLAGAMASAQSVRGQLPHPASEFGSDPEDAYLTLLRGTPTPTLAFPWICLQRLA